MKIDKGNVMKEVVLQVFMCVNGQFGGRILRDGAEDGRVEGCLTRVDVELQAIEAGINVDRVEIIDYVPSAE